MNTDPKGEFSRAHIRAFFDEIRAVFNGQPTELLSFDDIKAKLRLKQESYRGLQDVPLNRIIGSVGRYRDFTGTFLPKNRGMQERWSRIYNQFNSMEGLPPVDLFKVDDVYFVRDGNHRVSVARQQGFKTIQAHVTELPTPVDLEPGMTKRQLSAAAAYAHFLEESDLINVRPQQERITLTESGRYADLLLHIHLVRELLAHKHNREIPQAEASIHWYDNVYLPTITLIRKHQILQHAPKRTEADLYLWIVEYLWQLRQEYGPGGGEYRISAALIEFLDKKGIDIPRPLIDESDKPLFE